MDLMQKIDCVASVATGLMNLPSEAPMRRPIRQSLLRLRGKVAYWHKVNGKPGSWGVLKSGGKIKFHAHLSEFLNANRPPEVGQAVEFSPRPPRAKGELRRAVDVFVEREVPVN